MLQNILLKDVVTRLSRALDLLSIRINKHHQRATIISLKLGRELNLTPEQLLTLFYAGLLHDLGVASTRDKLDIMNFDYTNAQAHTAYGSDLLARAPFFRTVAEVVRCHHDHWLGPNKSGLLKDKIPVLSQILHLADRMETLIADNKYILEQVKPISAQINKYSGMWFNPELITCFNRLATREAFWLDLSTEFKSEIMGEIAPPDERVIPADDILLLSNLFREVVDAKSRHTKIHSASVTENAIKIGKKMNLSDDDLQLLKIAVLLHDLGKLGVPDEILEKPAALLPEEYTIVKKHPYYTYHILKLIKGFDEIARWAAFHHERPDGKGYPFGLKGDELPLGTRIIAVADMFTALTEDRPYRRKLSPGQALRLLEGEAARKTVDGTVVNTLKEVV